MLIVGVITLVRIVVLAFARLDLFVDESQYWLWGQEFAFGYYSKPPLIGWLIGAVTTLAGSDAPFWVRLPAPVLHGGTSLVLGGIAAQLFGARAGVMTAAGFVTLPMVALSSIFLSTDVVMFLPLAGALALYVQMLERPTVGKALVAGGLLGLAFMAKYAAVYYLICGGLAAVFWPVARLSVRDVCLILLAFVVVAGPNLWWNAVNGFTTFSHTLDNADWVREPAARAGLNFDGLVEFWAAQLAVFGPVLFPALFWFALHRPGPVKGLLAAFSLPVLALVSIQALLSGAYANWAAAAYIAGAILVLPHLPRWALATSFTLNGALCLALPLLAVMGDHPAAAKAVERYKGRTEMSRAIAEQARASGAAWIVAEERQILADLFYTLRDDPLEIRSVPPVGRPLHHYAQHFAMTDRAPGKILYATRSGQPPVCAPDATPVTTIAPETGAYRRGETALFLVPGDCWAQ
ncbi:ArnT family glycosyltransferase [Actibacterium mucosum]|uniref:ArnT family glycosyltransferase n=1 Tax=Actibacterium mucosum TaxID=1087332 RepID=UPI00068FF7AE|nr:glycosyltransferase family 39 protein [Actibacterium mucosum]